MDNMTEYWDRVERCIKTLARLLTPQTADQSRLEEHLENREYRSALHELADLIKD